MGSLGQEVSFKEEWSSVKELKRAEAWRRAWSSSGKREGRGQSELEGKLGELFDKAIGSLYLSQ